MKDIIYLHHQSIYWSIDKWKSQQVLILLSGGSNPSTPTKGLFPTLKLHFNRLNYWYGAQPHTGGPTIY